MRKYLFLLHFLINFGLAHAQGLDQLNLQVHGFATQSLLYTTQNNIFTTDSSDGSPAWTEAVLNISAQPNPKLRVSLQGRYFLLGSYGNSITLDYATADYKVDDRFGLRFGKVKTPSGLYNERQDASPCYLWALLPQGMYPIGSRDSQLSHLGGVVYGTLSGPPSLGKLEYRGWGGERVIPGSDGFFINYREAGLLLPDGLNTVTAGGALHWLTPWDGLMVGVSDIRNAAGTAQLQVPSQGLTGTESLLDYNNPNFFVRYAHKRLFVAGEYSRMAPTLNLNFHSLAPIIVKIDNRPWYAMAAYDLTGKLTLGGYYTQMIDHGHALGPARYSKDWDLTARYEFNEYVYVKAEQHFIDGTRIDYDTTMNQGGLKPRTRLTILNLGVSF